MKLKNYFKQGLILSIVVFFLTGIYGCVQANAQNSNTKTIRFADMGWDSVRFHNAVVGLIAERLFGYHWEEVSATSIIAHEALMNEEIDIEMETWTDNLPHYSNLK